MKLRTWPLAAAALLLVPALASAQVVVQNGQKFRGDLSANPLALFYAPDSTARLWRGDASGNAKVVDVDRDRDQVWQNLLWQNTLTRGASDSSSAISTRGWTRMAIQFFPSLGSAAGSDSIGYVLFGLTVRGHITPAVDSLTTMTWGAHDFLRGPGAAGVVQRDTIGTWANLGPGAGLTYRAGTGASDPTIIDIPDEILIAMRREEFVRGAGFGNTNGRGKWILLVDKSGAPFSAPYASARIRLISLKATDALGGGELTLTPNMKVQGYLVGWR